MQRTQILRTLLALVLGAGGAAGCADPAGGGGDDGGDDGGDLPDGDIEARPLDAAGTYRLHTKLDLAASVPGTAGQVVDTIIAITDDPDDPTLWVLDYAISSMPNGWVKTALQNAKPYVAGYLNDRILDLAPDFVSVAVQLANDVGQMAKGFGLNETLEVTGAPGAYTAKVTAVGARFTIDGIESDHAFADHGAPESAAAGVAVSLEDGGRLAIGEHRIEVSYGRLLRMGLDAAIIPMLEPGAHSLNELLASKVSCQLVGQAIAAAVGVGSAGTYATACANGLDAGANYIYSKIASIDGVGLSFGLRGAAKVVDKDRDRAVDTIHSGAWTGAVSYGGAAGGPLEGATFFGARM